jgi:cell division protein FtsL
MAKALPREWYGEGVRNFGVQREKVQLRGRTLLAYVAATAVLLVSLLLYVSQGLRVIGMGYELDKLQDHYRALKVEREQLEVEQASLQNLKAVEQEAVEKLGMVFPGPEQIIVVRETGGDPGELRSGAPAAPPAGPTVAARTDGVAATHGD